METNRLDVLKRLSEQVLANLVEIEEATGLEIVFQPLIGSYVVAQYGFDTDSNTATIFLRSDWQDVDVAHELMHMRLELIEGFSILAWKDDVPQTQNVESAFALVRGCVDDEVVHHRLAQQGLRVDGEILKSQLFDDIYTKVQRYLNKLRPRSEDCMSHLDAAGYGELKRSSLLVQAELVRKNFNDVLPNERKVKLQRFIESFRTHRGVESQRADQILNLFVDNDVNSIQGHRQILQSWSQREGLDNFVGISTYQKREDCYILPWPGN